MPRRKARAASSASAAAQSSVPTFTSFAAALSHALPSENQSVNLSLTEWDQQAIAISKRVTKRETVTKVRALADLVTHINSLQSTELAGDAFVQSWGADFRLALSDSAVVVREESLRVMALIVKVFRNKVQPIFGTVLPVWIAATWDSEPTVSQAATETLRETLSTPKQREKVLAKYKQQLIAHCLHLLRTWSDKMFAQHAASMLSVLLYIVQTSGNVEDITAVLDEPAFSLKRLAKGSQKSSANAAGLVSKFATGMLPYLDNSTPSHQKLAQRFASAALIAIRLQTPEGWELAIALYRDRWPSTFSTLEFSNLATTVADALCVPLPSAVNALLPLVDSLPEEAQPADFVVVVLNKLGRRLGVIEESGSTPAPFSYVLTALYAYLETCAFAYTTGASRWLSDSSQLDDYRENLFTTHIQSMLRLYLSGVLPRVSKMEAVSQRGETRSDSVPPAQKLVRQTASELANILCRTDKNDVLRLLDTVAPAVWNAFVSQENVEARCQRIESFLNLLDSTLYRCYLYKEVINSVDLEASPRAIIVTLTQLVSLSGSYFIGENNVLEGAWSEVFEKVEHILRKAFCHISDRSDSVFIEGVSTVAAWLYENMVASGLHTEADKVVLCILYDSQSEDQLFFIMEKIVGALRKMKEKSPNHLLEPLRGSSVTTFVDNAIDSIVNKQSSDAIQFLKTVMEAREEVAVPASCTTKMLKTATQVLLSEYGDAKFDRLVASLLTRPYDTDEHKQLILELARASLARAFLSKGVQEALVTYLRSLHVEEVIVAVNGMADVIEEVLKGVDQTVGVCTQTLSSIIKLLGENDIQSSVSISQRLLSPVSGSLSMEFLKVTPLVYVFGDGIRVPVDMKFFTSLMEALFQKYEQLLLPIVKQFLRVVGQVEWGRMGAEIAEFTFQKDTPVYWWILAQLIELWLDQDGDGEIVSYVSERIMQNISDFPDNVQNPLAAAQLIFSFCLQSEGELARDFEDVVTHCVKQIRIDPVSTKARLAIDMLTALVRGICLGQDPELETPEWLPEALKLAMRAIRRLLEQRAGANKEQLEDLETRGCLLFSCMLSIEELKDTILEDDLRFWFFRCRVALEKFGKKMANVSPKEERQWKRIGAVCSLTEDLVDYAESIDGPSLFSESVEDDLDNIIHLGAWSTVVILPGLHGNNLCAWEVGEYKGDSMQLKCLRLIMRAAEDEVLLGEGDRFPIARDYVYRTIPLLASHDSLTRKAVLTVITHAAAVDLPKKVKDVFPEGPFADENQETAAVHKVMPSELREALEYVVHSDDVENMNEVTRLEIGYFLSWRLFLDLVRIEVDKETQEERNDEFSFRRVGETYIRRHPQTFAEFIRKCTDIIIDGTPAEQKAAAQAAVEALAAEERAAQGIQLALQQDSKKKSVEEKKEMVSIGKEAEREVGRAAGIALSRALQRLPALSRDEMRESFDVPRQKLVESFVRKHISQLLISSEVRRVKDWGAFGGGSNAKFGDDEDVGEFTAKGSALSGELTAIYTFSDVSMEIVLHFPDTYPLKYPYVEPKSRYGMSEARWKKTLIGMETLLRQRDGSAAEAVDLWRRNMDESFRGTEECPICYSVHHAGTMSLPTMKCGTCKSAFHSVCLCKWFTKSNTGTCPMCRSPMTYGSRAGSSSSGR